MKKLFAMSLLVLSSMFASIGCTARSFDVPPVHYTVSGIASVSNVLQISNILKIPSFNIEEEPEQEKKRNSFWKLFALAITVLLVVLFL